MSHVLYVCVCVCGADFERVHTDDDVAEELNDA